MKRAAPLFRLVPWAAIATGLAVFSWHIGATAETTRPPTGSANALTARPAEAAAKDLARANPSPPGAAAPGERQALLKQKVDHYAALLDEWLRRPAPGSFEPVLAAGQAAASALVGEAELLDPATYGALVAKMRGYLILREEIVVAAPDPDWLAERMKAHGTPADIAFFDLMRRTLNGYWPVTMEQLDDLSGCTRYGSHDLVTLYGAWKDFQQKYPQAYARAVKDPDLLLLWDIEDQLLNGNSACEGPESVVDELETFARTYPASDLAPKIQARLDLLRKNKLDFFYYQGTRYTPTN